MLEASNLCPVFDVQVEIIKAICYCKLFVKNDEQMEITEKYEAKKQMMRVRYDLTFNTSGVFISGKAFSQLKIDEICSKLTSMNCFT